MEIADIYKSRLTVRAVKLRVFRRAYGSVLSKTGRRERTNRSHPIGGLGKMGIKKIVACPDKPRNTAKAPTVERAGFAF